MTDRERERELEEALKFGIECALNEMASRGLPLEWSHTSGLGVMFRALGCESTRLDDAARAALFSSCGALSEAKP